MIKMTAEQEIKSLLKNKGISAYRLSKETGISQTCLSEYFHGKTEMSANRYLKLKEIISKL